MWYNFRDLRWQYDWRGTALMNIYLLVCGECYDTPQQQLRAIVVPADPQPIINARVENFTADETDYRSLSAPSVYDPTTGILIPDSDLRTTQDGNFRTAQPVGPARQAPQAPGLDYNAVMPLQGAVQGQIQYGVALSLLSAVASGTTTISVTCSAPHNLTTNDQISAAGLEENAANGFYSVTVLTATAFTYMANEVIPAGALLTGGSRIVTANVGVPYGYLQIPQTGI